LVGVGAALRASSIRWGIVRELVGSWLLTFPLAVLVAAVLHWTIRIIGVGA
jgi:PiT family inorganic phosphate transporter